MVGYGSRENNHGRKIMGYYESYIENMGEPEMRKYYYEVYIKGPKGENGWDIQIGTVEAIGLEHGRKAVRFLYGIRFDEFIQFYEVTKDCVLTK